MDFCTILLFGQTEEATGLPVFWQIVLAVVATLSGPAAVLGKWLWDRWQETRRLREEENLKNHQRSRTERAEDDNIMIGHLREINSRYDKECQELRDRVENLEKLRTTDQVEMATMRVMYRRAVDWIRMLERMMTAKKLDHPPWNDTEPTGTEIRAALKESKKGEDG